MVKKPLQTNPNIISKQVAEARAIYVAGITFVIALVIALITFWPNSQTLLGGVSIGLVSAVLVTLSSFIVFFIGNYGQYPLDDSVTTVKRIRNGITKTALAFAHAAISFLATAGVFYLVSAAFQGLVLDPIASSVIVAGATAAISYIVYLAAIQITTLRVSTLMAGFLVSGVLVSMIFSADPYWWQMHFSSLGAEGTKSSTAFNATLVIAGLVAVALSDFIASDFRRLKLADSRHNDDRANIIRVCVALIGVFLAFVGLFIYDIHGPMHVLSAGGMVIIFIGLTAFSPWLMPSFSKAFISATYGFLAALVIALWLYKVNGYFTLTTFELVTFGIVFTWLIVFIRQIAAGLDEAESAQQSRAHLTQKS